MIWVWHGLEISSFNASFCWSEAIIILIQQIITIFQKHICKGRNSRISTVVVFMCIKSYLPDIMPEIFSALVLHVPYSLPYSRKIHRRIYNVQVVRSLFLRHWFHEKIRQLVPIFYHCVHNALQDICQTNLLDTFN